MTEFVELNLDEMANVTGGRLVTINTGTDQNAAIRNAPGNGDIIASLKNDTIVDTVGTPVYDSGTDRNWIRVKFKKKGKTRTGWVAASIVGLKRK